jgi:hypothetical protein
VIVRWAVAAELVLVQLLPVKAATSNQWLPVVSDGLVHDVPTTPVATEEKPVDDEVVDSKIV